MASDLSSSLGSGRPLARETRSFFEQRFGTDLGDVRIHSGNAAGLMSSDINARAFTFGRHVVLGAGENEANSRLMAHELTHVLQQNADEDTDRRIQRIVTVNPSTAAADDILDQVRFICPAVTFGRTGRTLTADQSSIASKGCECVTDVISDPARTYTINVDAVSNNPQPVTLSNGTKATVPDPSSGPNTLVGPNPTITMPATKGSAMEFGAFSPSGGALWCDNWRILGHELCGHARLNQSYAGSKGKRPGHDATIDTENAIAADHGQPTRGHFADSRQGESFHNPAGKRSKVVFMLVNGRHYEAP